MLHRNLRQLFEMASSLADERQKSRDHDESLMRWLVQQVDERGAKAMAELLDYDDAANLAKVVWGKAQALGRASQRNHRTDGS
jgi:hypothetical protein